MYLQHRNVLVQTRPLPRPECQDMLIHPLDTLGVCIDPPRFQTSASSPKILGSRCMIQGFTPTIVLGGRNVSSSFKPEASTTYYKLRPRVGCMRRPSLMTTE